MQMFCAFTYILGTDKTIDKTFMWRSILFTDFIVIKKFHKNNLRHILDIIYNTDVINTMKNWELSIIGFVYVPIKKYL